MSYLDLAATGRLNFSAPDEDRFPCLRLAREALRRGGCTSAVLNAANEVAVAAFLGLQMRFDQIPELLEAVMVEAGELPLHSLTDVFAADAYARQSAGQWLQRYAMPCALT